MFFDPKLIKPFDKAMQERNFSLLYTYDNGNKREYVHNENGITVRVCVADNSFELFYPVENSGFQLRSGMLSPFYESEPKYYQYEKMYNKFREIVRKINA